MVTAMHVIPSKVSTSLHAMPNKSSFSCNMFLNILFLNIKMSFLHKGRSWSMMNCFGINLDYQISQKILKYNKTHRCKLKSKTKGNYEIFLAHSNKTVTIILRAGINKHSMFITPIALKGSHILVILLGVNVSSSLIMGKKSVMPSRASHRTAKNLHW